MFRVGLTGGIASGKSAVAAVFARLGADVIDTDALARAVVAPGSPALADIVARFGAGVAPGGVLDRAALARIVFADAAARADLNAIVHPWVRATVRAIEARVSDPDAVVVQVIPLLVETGLALDFDAVVVVDTDEATQVGRVLARDGLTEAEARARLAAQASRVERLAAATFVVRNDGTPADLEVRAAACWEGLLGLRHEREHTCT